MNHILANQILSILAILIGAGTLLFGLVLYIYIRISEKRSRLWERVSEILKDKAE